jgi:hypothetical protein
VQEKENTGVLSQLSVKGTDPIEGVLSGKSGCQQILPFDLSDAERSFTLSNVACYLDLQARRRPRPSQVNMAPAAGELPVLYFTQGVLKEPKLAKEAGQGLLSIVGSYARGGTGGMASAGMGILKAATNGGSNPRAGQANGRLVFSKSVYIEVRLCAFRELRTIFRDSSLECDPTFRKLHCGVQANTKKPISSRKPPV